MAKNRKQASLTNVVQYDSNFNLSIGSSTSSSFNSSGSIVAASGFTGSLSGSVFGIGSPVSFSSSVSSDLINLESKSASVDISITNINSFTSSNGNTSLNQLTGSLATTGSNTFYGTQTYSGSVYIANDLVVQGSSSIQYISASSVSIGTNIVRLNTANPTIRYAGLTMIDSGSIGGSGSFLYDSVEDEFIFVHRGNGTNVTSSHFILGPETYDNLGNEAYLTCNRIPKGTGKEHLINSCIFDNGGNIGINCATPSYNLDVNGCGRFYQSLTNSTSYLIVENNRARNAAVYTATTNGGFYAGTSIGTDTFNYQIYDGVAGSPRITISSTGIANFSCQICVGGNVLVGNDINAYLEIANGGSTDGKSGIRWMVGSGRTSYGAIELAASSVSNGYLSFSTMNSGTVAERMRITNAGNVGIGTCSPSAKLDIQGANIYMNISDTSDSRYMNFGNWVACRSTIEIGGGDLFIKTQQSNYLAFGTAASERMRITSAGISCFSNTVCAPIVARCGSKWQLNGSVDGGNNACALVINIDNSRAVRVRGIVTGVSGQTMTSMGMYEAVVYRLGGGAGNESKRFAVLVDCNASPGNGQGIKMDVVGDTLYIQNKTGMSYAQSIVAWAEIFYA